MPSGATAYYGAGDLLLEKSGGGDAQPVGVVVLYDYDVEAVCSNFIARLRVAPDCESRYFTYLHSCLYAIRLNVQSVKQTTGIQNLDSESYLNEPVPFPPYGTQAAIAHYLDAAATALESTAALARRQVELIGAYRTRLIADVVTGKLDVREAAALLPEADLPVAAACTGARGIEGTTERHAAEPMRAMRATHP